MCSTASLNSDSSVYLAGCSVAGRNVDYSYGKEEAIAYAAYEVGDEVIYNNVDYYVIKNSGIKDQTVTLLKAEPITSTEISPYLSSTEVASKVKTSEAYAKVPYYSSDDCGSAGSGDQSGCSTDYSVSTIKQVVDIWKEIYANEASNARLITYEDLTNNLGFENSFTCTGGCYYSGLLVNVPTWVYTNKYTYWTMSSVEESLSSVWALSTSGDFFTAHINLNYIAVRPVLELNKSASITKLYS